MSKGMDWQRSHYQVRARKYGSTKVTDENERFADDRAARWLNKVEAANEKRKSQGIKSNNRQLIRN